jgi:hypothetical protein
MVSRRDEAGPETVAVHRRLMRRVAIAIALSGGARSASPAPESMTSTPRAASSCFFAESSPEGTRQRLDGRPTAASALSVHLYWIRREVPDDPYYSPR